jgi:glycosyltransferase involved in cell wall biosynthesis
MKVAVVAPSPVPFRVGGAERLFDGLTRAINDLGGHSADLVKLPTPESTLPEVLGSYRRFAELDLSHFDLVIATKYPAWMIEHDRKVVYVQHTLRGLYDAYHFTRQPTEVGTVPADLRPLLAATERGSGVPPAAVLDLAQEAISRHGADHELFRFPGPLARRIVHALDAIALSDERTVARYAISRTVCNRDYFPAGSPVREVYHPSNMVGLRSGPFEFFFTASRLDGPKRIGLLIDAYRRADLTIPLRIAGTGDELEHLREMAAGDSRIEFLGHVTENELIELYSRSLAVPFVPYDEDLGLITLEAMLSGKPVITCADSGGPTEFIRPGVNGLIAEPDPESLAEALRQMTPERARSMEAAAIETAAAVTWESVVQALVGGSERVCDQRGARDPGPVHFSRGAQARVLVLSTYPFFPAVGGGQIRGARLAEALAGDCNVEVLAPAVRRRRAFTLNPVPGITQRTVEWAEQFELLEDEWTALAAGLPISDITAGLFAPLDQGFRNAVDASIRSSDAVVLSHPYLASVVADVDPKVTTILDAVDVELHQKSAAIGKTTAGPYLLRAVEALERLAIELADVVSVCSARDGVTLQDVYGADAADIVLVPNGTDVNATPYTSVDRRRRLSADLRRARPGYEATAVFVGSWHPPNIDAARFILDAATELRHVHFALVGSHSRFFEDWSLPPNVSVLGIVSDAVKQGLLASADVALNPMVAGSGTNLKLLEYFAAGIPVVSTSVGARGIDVEPGRHYVAAELNDFTDVVSTVLTSPADRWAPMVERARRVVEDQYDWRVIGEHFARTVMATLDA